MDRLIRYDSEWEEVKIINGYVVHTVYVSLTLKGLGYLAVTWTTVVLLGGFVSNLSQNDFWRVALITLVQILGINASFIERLGSVGVLFSSLRAVKSLLTRDLVQNNNPKQQSVKRVVAAVGCIVEFVYKVMLLCICIGLMSFVTMFGLLVCTLISVQGIIQHQRCSNGRDEGTTNMDIAHNILYTLCIVQGALWLYKLMLAASEKGTVKQVSQAYGFEDDGAVSGYLKEIKRGCLEDPSSARGRNIITYAIELMESKSFQMCLSGTLILDRLLTRRQNLDKIGDPDVIQQDETNRLNQQSEDKTRTPLSKYNSKIMMNEEQHGQLEEEIISMQHRVIKRLIVSTSYTNILQKLLEMLDSRSLYDRGTREAAARIVDHVSTEIYLEQFPRGIQCISSLINTFEEYRLQPYQSLSSPSRNKATTKTRPSSSNTNTKPSPTTLNGHEKQGSNNVATLSKFKSGNGMDQPSSLKATKSKTASIQGYKELVLTGLHILWGLTFHHENCIIIRNTKHLVSKIMAPIAYDLVHRAHHSAWSTEVIERSLRIMSRLVTVDGETGVELRRRISSDNNAMGTMERILRCDECQSVELQMKVVHIITALVSMDGESESRVSFTKMLVSIFVHGDCSNVFIRKTAGEALYVLFFSNKHVPTIENNDASEFIGGLVKIVSQVGEDNICRIIAARILERLCIRYTESTGTLNNTLKNAIASVMPTVLREILLCYGSVGEGNPVYVRSGADVESQVPIDFDNTGSQVDNNDASSSPEKSQEHKLHVSLLSMCVTTCEKLHLEFYRMNPVEESAAFSFTRKMVQLKSDLTLDCLTTMKLTTRMVIEIMKHRGVVEPANRLELEGLLNSLSNVSESMLDLESSMVFSTRMALASRTLESLVKEARELYNQIKDLESPIV